MKLAPKLLAPILAMSIALVGIVGYASWLQEHVAAMDGIALSKSNDVITVDGARSLSRALERDLVKAAFYTDAKAVKALSEDVARRNTLLKERSAAAAETLNADDPRRAQYRLLTGKVVDVVPEILKLLAANDHAAGLKLMNDVMEPARLAASTLTDQFVAEATKHAKEANETAESTRKLSRVLLIALSGALILVLTLSATAAVLLGVIRPMKLLTAGIQRLQAGDYETPVNVGSRKDEIGEMAVAAEGFRGDLASARSANEHRLALEKAALAEREANEAAKARDAAEVQSVMDELGHALNQLAGGDLTARFARPVPPRFDRVKSDFNASIERLERAVLVIVDSSRTIQSGTIDISQAASELSSRTEQQAANLEESAAALEEITATVKRTAESAEHAKMIVFQTKQSAESSGKVVTSAMSAMSGIEKSSEAIGGIISVIDEIAFQTNLLALNAGVEAARAGESGRGFAVVASEVRALAQRSAEAAKEIKSLISTSIQQVAQGVSLVGETGASLEQIISQVAEVANVVTTIAASAKEQATAIEEVNTAVSQMDQLTQQNAAMVEETTAASHSLATEARQMDGQVRAFKVTGSTETRSMRSAA